MKNLLAAAVVAAIVSFAVTRGLPSQTTNIPSSSQDKFMERVESTNTVRCGYVNNPPFVALDPTTQELHGIMVDATAKIGQITGWKIVWSGETSYSTMTEDLAQGKFDVFCGGSWPIALSEKRQWWAGPLFYSGVAAFVRADDSRFNNDFKIQDLNSDSFSISVIDGVAVDLIRSRQFSKMKVVSLPALSSYAEMITQVVDHKADVVMIEQETAYRYMKENPGKIRRIGGDKPIRLYGMGYEFSYDAPRLRNVFEITMRELVNGGEINQLLDANETVPNTFYRVPFPAMNATAE